MFNFKGDKKNIVHVSYIQIQHVQDLSPFSGYNMRSNVEALDVDTEV